MFQGKEALPMMTYWVNKMYASLIHALVIQMIGNTSFLTLISKILMNRSLPEYYAKINCTNTTKIDPYD